MTHCGMDPAREAQLAAELARERARRMAATGKPDGRGGKRAVVPLDIKDVIRRMCAEQFHPEYIARVVGVSISLVYGVRDKTRPAKVTRCPFCEGETVHQTPQMCIRETKTALVNVTRSAAALRDELAAARAEAATRKREAQKLQRRFAQVRHLVDEVAK